MKRQIGGLWWIVMLGTIISCSDGADGPGNSNFDRSGMLKSMAQNLIIPNFESLQSSVSDLATTTETFNQNTTEDNLVALQISWAQAATDLQHCSAFGFGPGLLPLGPFTSVLGAFPVNELEVEQNILDPDFNLAASFSRDIRGFYTIEYLIYGTNSNNAEVVVSQFDQNRKDYLNLIVGELKTTVDSMVLKWNAEYLTEFVASDGTSAGSSVALLYNGFVKDYENLKNFKVELPAGLIAGQTSAVPSSVEAFYSGISLNLMKEHFQSSENIWLGRTGTGEDITGFEEYLASVIGGPELIGTTKAAIIEIQNAMAAVPDGRLSENIESDEVETLRNELQANTPNFKSAMSSLLGIAITFNSGDGD